MKRQKEFESCLFFFFQERIAADMNVVYLLKQIPTEVYREVQQFCHPSEFNRFTNTTKQFEKIKYEARSIIIRPQSFYSITEFQEIIQRLVNDPYLQVIVFDSSKSLLMLEGILNIEGMRFHKFNSLNPQNLITIKNWMERISHFHEVSLSFDSWTENFTNILPTTSIRKMKLRSFSKLTDISSLTFLRELTLSSCFSVTDVSMLRNLHRLRLESCQDLVDVSALGNIPDLSILSCQSITDISKLTNNRRLLLFGLSNVKVDSIDFFSQFRNCVFLDNNFLNSYTHISHIPRCKVLSLESYLDSDFPVLESLRSLTFSRLKSPIPLSLFHSLHELSFYSCETLETLDGIGNNIRVIRISHCFKLRDINALRIDPSVNDIVNRRHIALEAVHVTDFSPLQNYYKVVLVHCLHLTDTSCLKNIQFLILKDQSQFISFSKLENISNLKLINCHQLTSIQSFITIPYLEIRLCRALKSLFGLGEFQEKLTLAFEEKGKYFSDLRFKELIEANYLMEILKENRISSVVFLRKLKHSV